MFKIFIVGAGGFVGSGLRYAIGSYIHRVLGAGLFPYGTLAVNVTGCLLIGFVSGISESKQLLSHEATLFLTVGLLGGFTTFSAFGFETFSLARNGKEFTAFLNVGLQVFLCFASVWLGFVFSRSVYS